MRFLKILLFIGLGFWSCEEEQEPKDCAGVTGGDNICGCTDSLAINFDNTATYDDESCAYDTTPPNITITFIAEGSVSEMVSISCISTDNESIEKVELWINGVATSITDTTEPYSLEWNTTLYENGSYVITVRSYDTSGNVTDSDPITLTIENSPYTSNPDMNGQFFDAVLVNRNPDCRAYSMDANDGDYGSNLISDLSNGISNAVSDVHIDLVIASNWNPSDYDYDSVTLTIDPELATHCRITSNMIPNHTFGVEVTGPGGDGWINAIDHSDIEVTYIPVDPVRTDTPTDTPRNPPTYDFDGILLNGVGISMDSGFCYNPGVTTGPPSLQSNEACNTSGCGPQNSWFELPAYTIWQPDAEYMAGIFDSYFAHGYVGTYHYHALTHPLQEDTDQTQPPANGDGSPVIGFAPDGFPIYGHWFIDANNQLVIAESGYETYTTDSRTPIETALHGTPPTPWDIANNSDDFACDFGLEMGRYEEDWYFAGTGNLDECNGAYDVNGDYGYYITDKYPFTPPCTFGAREPSFSKQSPTLPQQVAVDYSSGWNMVGLALDVGNTHYQTLFPEAYTGTLFSYDDAYQSETMLIPGTGYLLRLSSGGTTDFSGQPINELTLSLTEGWNLISGISTPVDANVFYSSGLVITGGIYGYDGSYFNADVIYPGRGYWVRANNSGSIILTSE